MVSRQLALGIAVGVCIAFLLTSMRHLHGNRSVTSLHLQRDARLHEKLDQVVGNISLHKKVSELESLLREESKQHDEELAKNEELVKKQETLEREKADLIKEQEKLLREHIDAQKSEHGGDSQNADSQNAPPAKSDELVENESVAEQFKKKIRVLVWVMTQPKNLRNQAKAVKETWGTRCNKILFMSSKADKNFPTVGLDVKEGRNHLTAKTMQAFRYVYENHFDDYDWFMKADDDTFVIMENLRFFLSAYNTSEPIYFGHLFQALVKQGYYSGGAGYVLSKEALRRLAQEGVNPGKCRQDWGAEDVNMGHCMENLGVQTQNTTDARGRNRFFPLSHEMHMGGLIPDWMYRFETTAVRQGRDAISQYAISFHYVSPVDMYKLYFSLYHLHAYGINNTDDVNAKQKNRLLEPGANANRHNLTCVNRKSCEQELYQGAKGW